VVSGLLKFVHETLKKCLKAAPFVRAFFRTITGVISGRLPHG
jgi:hypothetical protein